MLSKAKEELSWYKEHYGDELLADGENDDPIENAGSSTEASKEIVQEGTEEVESGEPTDVAEVTSGVGQENDALAEGEAAGE